MFIMFYWKDAFINAFYMFFKTFFCKFSVNIDFTGYILYPDYGISASDQSPQASRSVAEETASR